MLNVLLVEDNPGDADLVRESLADAKATDVTLECVGRLQSAVERLSHGEGDEAAVDVVLLDLSLPDSRGFEGLRRLRAIAPRVPIVVLTGSIDASAGTEALREGAQDYLTKGPDDRNLILRSIRYARERQVHADREQQVRRMLVLNRVGVALHSSLDPAAMRAALCAVLNDGFATWSCVEDADDHARRPDHDDGTATRPARVAELRALGLDAVLRVAVPGAADRAGGSITLARPTLPFDAADVTMLEEVAGRTAAALERIELFAQVQRERARAEDASRVKDEFLATLSHELRTPLTAILGWVQLLRRGQLPEDKRPHALEIIERNTHLQVALIEDVLDVSRVLSGKLHLQMQPVDLALVAAAAAESAQPTAAARGVALRSVVAAHETRVLGDPGRLQQVLANLLSNAIKFTPRGGHVELAVWGDDDEVVLTVVDSGQGIEGSFLPNVFDRFRQADGTSQRAHGGLGLGLSIVRHVVEQHGGGVVASSDGLGRGATFTVRLPALPVVVFSAPRAEAAAPPASLPDLRGLRVLLVEDEADTREMLASVLGLCGAFVAEAAAVPAALALFRAGEFDVIVSDIAMPDEDGYALIRQVRADPAERARTVAVALTANAGTADRDSSLRAGFDHHIAKPIDPGAFASFVAGVVPGASAERRRSAPSIC